MAIPNRTLIPVTQILLGDIDTPVSAYLKLNRPDSFLLESVTGGEQVARYSILGFDPLGSFVYDGKTPVLNWGGRAIECGESAIDALESVLASIQLEVPEGLPRFIGGAVGYFSWETIQDIESIKLSAKPEPELPRIQFLFPGSLVIFDHATRKITVVVLSEPEGLAEAKQKMDEIVGQLQAPIPPTTLDLTIPTEDPFSKTTSNFSKSEFMDMVQRSKQHIYDGDVFQLVLSQRFEVAQSKDPFLVYRLLRCINPSPYMYYFNFGSSQVIGSSPEILVRLEDREALVRPIAGTRPRRPGQDAALEADLLADHKERAEHVMLVDLGRNDLGRVCEYSSVTPSQLMRIERYSHVMHMVSDVTGKLRDDKTAFDLFKATFPAGTVSGAPKIRAIELIDEMEPDMRGLYAGALGYIDYDGNMDLCIVIRTVLAHAGRFVVQAGAGIVADSDPENEFFETQNKARGILQACL